jgi:alpha-galactosidase
MSVEDAAATVFSADHDAAAALLHMRAQGVSALMQLKPTGLPVILHWGADLGDLDGLSAEALLAAFGQPAGIPAQHLPDPMTGIPPPPASPAVTRG